MRFLVAVLAFVIALAGYAQGDIYPGKPVQVVLPLQAGSASDVAVRIFAERLGTGLRQSLVIENVTGAAGLIGADLEDAGAAEAPRSRRSAYRYSDSRACRAEARYTALVVR